MPNDKCAVVFENALPKASRATWVFVTDNENYEDCIKLVGEYFINNTTTNKRLSLRKKGANPPEKFKAEDYTFIDHNELGQWLKKLNRILENKPQPSDIKFVPGLNIPQSSDTRTNYMTGSAARTARIMLVLKSEWELNELMLLLKVVTSTIYTKSRLPSTHSIVSQRHWVSCANMPISSVVIKSERWSLQVPQSRQGKLSNIWQRYARTIHCRCII